jgi:hypothetical protein
LQEIFFFFFIFKDDFHASNICLNHQGMEQLGYGSTIVFQWMKKHEN